MCRRDQISRDLIHGVFSGAHEYNVCFVLEIMSFRPMMYVKKHFLNIFTLFFSAFRISKGRQISVPFACKDREICRENAIDNRRILSSFRSVPVCQHLTSIETLNAPVLYFPQPGL